MTVIRDESSEEVDEALATFVINSHMRNHPSVRKALASGDENDADGQAMRDHLAWNLLDGSRLERNQAPEENQVP